MACEHDDFLPPLRPFPHDVSASFAACADTFEARVADFDELTPPRIREFVAMAARGHRYILFCIDDGFSPPDRNESSRRFMYLRRELGAFLPQRLAMTLMRLHKAGEDTYSIRLYSYEEASLTANRAARVHAVLTRHGISLDEPEPSLH